jgi:hypothetical protein
MACSNVTRLFKYADGCSGKHFNLTSTAYLGNQCNAFNEITKIIESDLEFHEDGLPKPKYCKDNGVFPQDPRCGWSVPTNQKLASTTGKKFFDMWFRDNPVYNLRAGYTLTLNSISSTQFHFNSNFFVPLAENFGTGLKPCLATAGRTLDCSNGGKSFPLADKLDIKETADAHFTFTSEHHSFFQLKGTEVFTFSGVSLRHSRTSKPFGNCG